MPDLALVPVMQRDGYSCGRCVFISITDYLGVAAIAPRACPVDGLDPRSLEIAFRRCGLKVVSGEMDVDQLRYHVRANRPVACLVTQGTCGHWVCVKGVSHGKVRFVCPVRGEDAEPVTVFDGRWRDEDRTGVTLLRWGLAVG